jgi:hypothetical protein
LKKDFLILISPQIRNKNENNLEGCPGSLDEKNER